MCVSMYHRLARERVNERAMERTNLDHRVEVASVAQIDQASCWLLAVRSHYRI